MRNITALAFFVIVACDSPGSKKGADCTNFECGTNQVCTLDFTETCTGASCEENDYEEGPGCVCNEVSTPMCECAPGAVAAGDGCRVITRGYEPFTIGTVAPVSGLVSVTDANNLTACGLADSPSLIPSGAASQLLMRMRGTCSGDLLSFKECALPSRGSYLDSDCAWFRRFDAGGQLVAEDVAISGAIKGDLDTENWQCHVTAELYFANGASYVGTFSFDLDTNDSYEGVCTHP